MNIVTEIDQWQQIRNTLDNQSIGLVHTMGNLHEGHLSLCQRSQAENEITVVSIFINPTQFNSLDDFKHYPRTLKNDITLLRSLKIDYVLCPRKEDIYPDRFQVQISETKISHELEGIFRPGHFTGMLTIVLKHLNLIRPTSAYYGEKDYQQLLLINKMAKALFLPIKIVGCETIRAHDKLTLSSRNNRLNDKQRKQAAHFPRLLHSDLTIEETINQLLALGFKVDYIVEKWQRRLGAVWIDDVRLIDNVRL